MANTSAIWQQAAHTTYQLSSPSCSTRDIQKSLILNEKYLRVSGKKCKENGPLAEKWRDRKSKRTRQKKTRQEIGKGNQMTALRFQTGGRHQTSPASLGGGGGQLKTGFALWTDLWLCDKKKIKNALHFLFFLNLAYATFTRLYSVTKELSARTDLKLYGTICLFVVGVVVVVGLNEDVFS